MPNRILREAIITSRAVSALSDSGQIFYRCLMSVVDDYGRFESDLDLLRARCFPRQLDRWPLSRVGDALSECREARSSDGEPLLSVYSDGISDKMYCQINNFGQRIRSDKKGDLTPSKYPSPPIDSEPPRAAASSGDMPPKALALALAESHTHPTEEPPLMIPPPTSEFPLAIAEIRKHDPAVNELFVRALVARTVQHCLSSKEFPQEKLVKITDKNMARMIQESYATGPAKHGTGLLLSRVPPIAVSWAQEKTQ